MISYKNSLLFCLLFLLCIQAYSQSINSSIMLHASVLDTIESRLNQERLHVLWLHDTLTVAVQHEVLQTDTVMIAKYRKAFKDSSMWRTEEDIDLLFKSIRMGASNCYVYALEQYFENQPTYNQELFNELTSMDRESAEKILNHYFVAIDSIETTPKKNLKQPFPDDVLLGFVNKLDWTIHMVYHDQGIFYSKNGYFSPMTFESLKKFLKIKYWDTTKIRVYRLDENKIEQLSML